MKFYAIRYNPTGELMGISVECDGWVELSDNCENPWLTTCEAHAHSVMRREPSGCSITDPFLSESYFPRCEVVEVEVNI